MAAVMAVSMVRSKAVERVVALACVKVGKMVALMAESMDVTQAAYWVVH